MARRAAPFAAGPDAGAKAADRVAGDTYVERAAAGTGATVRPTVDEVAEALRKAEADSVGRRVAVLAGA
jgi:hypothetical protein